MSALEVRRPPTPPDRPPAADDLAQALRRAVKGDVRFDHFSRVLYSTDASMYQIMPIGVVIPRDAEDVAAAVRVAAAAGVPVLPRGSGTSLAGQSVGRAVILDCSRQMDRILEVSATERWVRVQPGVIQDELNQHLRPYGLRLGPDTATSNRASLGGMIGNNSSGARSIVYGKMVDHVQEVTVVLSGGDVVTFGPVSDEQLREKMALPTPEGHIYRVVSGIAAAHRDEIERRYPKIQRRVSGYNLDELLTPPMNLAKLIVGSEGTLAAVVEAKVGLVPRPARAVTAVVHFHDMLEALEATQEILPLGPSAVELIDRMIIDLTRETMEYARRMTFVEGDPQALLVVEFAGDHKEELVGRLDDMEQRLRAARLGYAVRRAVADDEQDNIWRVRKAGQGLLQGIKGDSKPTAFIEDCAVPPEKLPAYIRRVQEILARHGLSSAYYAHASVGVIHVRPLVNLKTAPHIETMRRVAEEVSDVVLEFGGAMSGEHGDGLARSGFVEKFFGPTLYQAFRQVKAAFDPRGIMNPGKIVDGPSMTADLRYGPDYRMVEIPTHFDFSRDGGLAGHVEMCSGLGACRKTVEGTMCPSYMVTREEEHSTRGRANLLRAVLSGLLPPEEMTGRRLYDALDLCLECKGCKGECPANVDMAKLKAEFLAGYYAKHGVPLRARLFGHIALLNRLGSHVPRLATWATGLGPVRLALEHLVGIDRRRPLPPFAKPTFARWFARRPRLGSGERGKVALFVDTYMNYNYPAVGMAATILLERTGFEVVPVDPGCCGRPMISKGLLPQAKAQARRVVDNLLPLARAGVPIVGCEPSCLLSLRDEYLDLGLGSGAEEVAGRALLIDEFLAGLLRRGEVAFSGGDGRRVLLHGHCHQKAIVGTGPAVEVLRAAGCSVQEIDSGCCGMAGSFGFEAEHYDLSMAVGERRLLPAVRNLPADADVVAMGVSCRQQIAHGTGRRAKHLAEVVLEALRS